MSSRNLILSAESELKELHGIQLREELGKGAYAVVRACVKVDQASVQKNPSEASRTYAIKLVDLRPLQLKKKFDHQRLLREVEILKSLHHKNIVRLEGVFDLKTVPVLAILMEYAPGKELFDHILAKGSLSEDESRVIFSQILSAVQYLHSQSIVHRDLKPENILLNYPQRTLSGTEIVPPTVKLIDFGLSKTIGVSQARTFVGTPQYHAPEVEPEQRKHFGLSSYGTAADMWSLGAVLYVMLAGRFPDYNLIAYPDGRREKLVIFEGEKWANRSNEVKDLIKKLMDWNPHRRIIAKNASEHPWLQSLATQVRHSFGFSSDIPSVYGENQSSSGKSHGSSHQADERGIPIPKKKSDSEMEQQNKSSSIGSLSSMPSQFSFDATAAAQQQHAPTPPLSDSSYFPKHQMVLSKTPPNDTYSFLDFQARAADVIHNSINGSQSAPPQVNTHMNGGNHMNGSHMNGSHGASTSSTTGGTSMKRGFSQVGKTKSPADLDSVTNSGGGDNQALSPKGMHHHVSQYSAQLSNVCDHNKLLTLQIKVASALENATLVKLSKPLAGLIRLNAVECRSQLNDSVRILKNLGGTSASVLNMLPDLMLAIQEGETDYAATCFATIRKWIRMLKEDANMMILGNRKTIMQINKSLTLGLGAASDHHHRPALPSHPHNDGGMVGRPLIQDIGSPDTVGTSSQNQRFTSIPLIEDIVLPGEENEHHHHHDQSANNKDRAGSGGDKLKKTPENGGKIRKHVDSAEKNSGNAGRGSVSPNTAQRLREDSLNASMHSMQLDDNSPDNSPLRKDDSAGSVLRTAAMTTTGNMTAVQKDVRDLVARIEAATRKHKEEKLKKEKNENQTDNNEQKSGSTIMAALEEEGLDPVELLDLCFPLIQTLAKTQEEEEEKKRRNGNEHSSMPNGVTNPPSSSSSHVSSNSNEVTEIEVQMKLREASRRLQEVDSLLEQYAQFWTNMDFVVHFLMQKTDHVNSLVSFARNKKLRRRFMERVKEYKDVWRGVFEMSGNYVARALEVKPKIYAFLQNPPQ